MLAVHTATPNHKIQHSMSTKRCPQFRLKINTDSFTAQLWKMLSIFEMLTEAQTLS